ncbi:MAG: DUF166 domain-containing protein [Proteobacteria bacterium]|nr:DUF166 domain-containing protein [Pseudomonadota bacterium]
MQRIWVFEQGGSARAKIRGLKAYGQGSFDLTVHSLDQALPPVLDDTSPYFPQEIRADLVLDFLRHPDLSLDLARLCQRDKVPMVASGKKMEVPGVLCPPT